MIQIWTDGSVMEHIGAWAATIKRPDGTVEHLSGTAPNVRSSRMEILAVYEGLKATQIGDEIMVFTDSTYIVNALEKGWVYQWRDKGWLKPDGEPVSNTDLWAGILKLCQNRIVDATWVRAHSGHPDNEYVDLVARRAAAAYLQTPERAEKNIDLGKLQGVEWHLSEEQQPPLAGTDTQPDFEARERYLVKLVSSKEHLKDKPLVRELIYHWREYKKKPPVRQWFKKPKHYDVVAWAHPTHRNTADGSPNLKLVGAKAGIESPARTGAAS